MPVREIPVCAKCASDIEEDPTLGDRQGGVREFVHPGTTWRITLCTKCLEPLFALYEEFVELVKPGGTAKGSEVLKYLPRLSDDDPDPQGDPQLPAMPAAEVTALRKKVGLPLNGIEPQPPRFSGRR